MNKIPTAENLLRGLGHYSEGDIIVLSVLMIEHTKSHVEAALKAASENVESKEIYEPSCSDHTPYRGVCGSCGSYNTYDVLVGSTIDKESILNAYPLENVK